MPPIATLVSTLFLATWTPTGPVLSALSPSAAWQATVAPEVVDGMEPQDMAASIDTYVSALAAEERFSGAVLLAYEGEPVLRKAWGLANRRYAVPNTPETAFNLGSMNKMFTAVAIGQLVEAGKLDFEDRLIEHLPAYPNRDVAERVTLRHLLTHTSGLGDFWEAMFARDWTRLRTPSDHLELFVDDPLAFEPGARFSYSNAGFLVLGLVIEAVSGQSYYDYVRENVYARAGMERSGSWAIDDPVEHVAMGYTRLDAEGRPGEGRLRENVFLHRARGGPAGGGYSTVDDLLRFANALLASELLDPSTTQTLVSGHVETGWGGSRRYGFGFLNADVRGHERIGHGGGAPGINGELAIYPADGYTVVVLANFDGAASLVAQQIGEMIVRADD